MVLQVPERADLESAETPVRRRNDAHGDHFGSCHRGEIDTHLDGAPG
jgi:hypothetical protein